MMKKLLGIVVLGLLLSGNANAKNYTIENYLTPGLSKKEVKKRVQGFMSKIGKIPEYKKVYSSHGTNIGYGVFFGGVYRQYFPEFNIEILSHYYSKGGSLNDWSPNNPNTDPPQVNFPYYVFEYVTEPVTCTGFHKCSGSLGNGVLKGVVFSKKAAFDLIGPEYAKKIEEERKRKEEEKKIVEKPKENPKKKKPKSTPSDDKIVAAGSGSGFFVSSNGTVITNHHVIEGCKINKVSHKGSQYEAKVLAVDKVNDIAILKTNIRPDRVFPVSNEDVSLLEDVVVAGYPLGKQVSSAIKTHKGVVTALAGAGDNYSNFQTDASINQGNSGGPILDQKGNVVGIAVATWVEEGVQGVHFGIKSSTLKTFASANGLKFLPANNRDLSNKDLGKLIMQSTVYVECHMTIAKIKKMIAEAENKKAFFKEFE